MFQKRTHFFKDIFILPEVRKACLSVVFRNYLVFLRSLPLNIIFLTLEPLIYLLIFAYGISPYMSQVQGIDHLEFAVPGLLVIFANYFGLIEVHSNVSLNSLNLSKFKTMNISPVSSQDIAMGELIWASLRGVVGTTLFSVFCYFLEIISFSTLIAFMPLLFVSSWVAAAIGLYVYCDPSSGSSSSLLGILFIPVALLSDTVVAASDLPYALMWVAKVFPVYHAVTAVRVVASGFLTSELFFHLVILLLYAVVTTNLAVARFERKMGLLMKPF